MADEEEEEDSVRLPEKRAAEEAMGSLQLQQPPLKKRNVSQSETPDHHNSRSEIFKNETPEVDIFDYLHQLEMDAKMRPSPDYIEKVQKDFSIEMRAIVVDWLFKVAERCKLRSDIMHQTISYMDRYLSVNALDRQRVQLLGVSSMLICSKYDEERHPRVDTFCYVSNNSTCSKPELVKMEAEILKSLNFEMGNPTVKTFLRKFIRVAQGNRKEYDLQLEFLCDYLAELSLLDYACLKFVPSLVAASVVFLSIFTIKPNSHPIWSSALQKESGYEPTHLKDCVLYIHALQTGLRGGPYMAVRDKYNQHEFKCVSKLTSPAARLSSSLFDGNVR